jgi:hypothetical protein
MFSMSESGQIVCTAITNMNSHHGISSTEWLRLNVHMGCSIPFRMSFTTQISHCRGCSVVWIERSTFTWSDKLRRLFIPNLSTFTWPEAEYKTRLFRKLYFHFHLRRVSVRQN